MQVINLEQLVLYMVIISLLVQADDDTQDNCGSITVFKKDSGAETWQQKALFFLHLNMSLED